MLTHPFSTHLTFVNDPGHGWLKVPLTDIAALGIEAQITPYSYIEGQFAYLEEDLDAPRYLEALTARGIPQPKITDQYVERFSRNKDSFPHDPAFWDKLRS
ncbi:MAG: hypothetical protein V9E94_10560 [Microthrixaceae bacterium]|nr:hypothetical protein [Chloroflexota bacterium]